MPGLYLFTFMSKTKRARNLEKLQNLIKIKMVLLSRNLLSKAARPDKGSQNWIDSLRIACKGGQGGNGFPKYGGLGGNGGSVIIKVREDSDLNVRKKKDQPPTNLTSLFRKEFKRDPKKQKLKGMPGRDSSKARINGEHGEDKVLIVSFRIKMLYFSNMK